MYHVGVSNIFELLDDENDEEGKKKGNAPSSKQDTTQSKTKVATPSAKEQPRKNEPAATKAKEAPVVKNERRPKFEGEKSARRPRENTNAPSNDASNDNKAGGHFRPEGRGRRDNKEREFNGIKTKRVYDRKSGTGRGKEIKKGGGGRGNWGKEATQESWDEEVAAEAKTETPNVPENTEVVVAAAPKVENTPAVKEESEEEKKKREEEEKKKREEEEKEQRQMTMEDYRKKLEAEKAEKVKIIPDLPAPRQAGEGVDSSELQKWATFTPIKRDEEAENKDASPESKKGKKEPKKQSVPADKVLNFKPAKKARSFEPSERGDRERGGEQRGNRERGENKPPRRERGEYNNNKDSSRTSTGGGGKRQRGTGAPDVQDASSFPALSKA